MANGQRVQRQCILREGRAIIETLGCVFTKDGIIRSVKPEKYIPFIIVPSKGSFYGQGHLQFGGNQWINPELGFHAANNPMGMI